MAIPETQDTGHGSLDVTLPAHPASVTQARSLVTALLTELGATSCSCDVTLALSEACGNVVLHAYDAGDAGGTMRVAAQASGRTLIIEVEDHGRGCSRTTPLRASGSASSSSASCPTTRTSSRSPVRGRRSA